MSTIAHSKVSWICQTFLSSLKEMLRNCHPNDKLGHDTYRMSSFFSVTPLDKVWLSLGNKTNLEDKERLDTNCGLWCQSLTLCQTSPTSSLSHLWHVTTYLHLLLTWAVSRYMTVSVYI